MDVHDEHLPAELFAEFTAHLPEVCVELVVVRDGGVLLARRANEPAKGEWFWPGGRLYKGEEPADAATRVAREELGVAVEVVDFLGVYSHFWETSALPGGPSRHTVNLQFRVRLQDDPAAITLDDQHTDYRFLTAPEPGLHEYVQRYLDDAGVFG